MKNNGPIISIGMPVRNNETTLGLAVKSILNQTYPNWELLLINDGSTDNTLGVARSFNDDRIKILSYEQGLGLPARLNQAIEVARGEYFARMDGDDISYPERFERQVQYLQQHSKVDLVGAEMLVYGPGGRILGKRSAPRLHAAICARPTAGFGMAHATFMGKISFFRRYKYRVAAVRCEDQDLLQRAHLSSVFANVPEILYGVNEDLQLKKILLARLNIARSFSAAFLHRGRPDLSLRAVAGQGAKGIVDVIAIGSGLNYKILRHRARPLTPEERRRWEQVWAQVTRSSDDEAT